MWPEFTELASKLSYDIGKIGIQRKYYRRNLHDMEIAKKYGSILKHFYKRYKEVYDQLTDDELPVKEFSCTLV